MFIGPLNSYIIYFEIALSENWKQIEINIY